MLQQGQRNSTKGNRDFETENKMCSEICRPKQLGI